MHNVTQQLLQTSCQTGGAFDSTFSNRTDNTQDSNTYVKAGEYRTGFSVLVGETPRKLQLLDRNSALVKVFHLSIC